MKKLVGKEGIALTPMMPTGIIKVEGKKFDALSSGERIEKNSVVVVRRIEGNRIYVRKKG
ncbi:MAG: NfeD family protein [Planctomycetota bacterium]|nr:NfeD family protein [Planctomycetota bacterium]